MNDYQHTIEQLLQEIEAQTQQRYRLEASNAYGNVERELAETRERLARLIER
jgi:hypothetical protein